MYSFGIQLVASSQENHIPTQVTADSDAVENMNLHIETNRARASVVLTPRADAEADNAVSPDVEGGAPPVLVPERVQNKDQGHVVPQGQSSASPSDRNSPTEIATQPAVGYIRSQRNRTVTITTPEEEKLNP